MRKSNLLLIAALLVLLVSLGMYNISLKAEYLKGTYKDPFKEYKPLAIKDFQSIDINAKSRLNVRIMAGPFNVWVHEKNKEFVQVSKAGNRLQIEGIYTDRDGYYEGIIITCPRISDIKVNATFQITRKSGTTTEVMTLLEDVANVSVEGFEQDSLLLEQDNASVIKLINNKLGKLRSITGLSPGAMSKLEISPDNTIQEADLTVKRKGTLLVQAAKITRLKYDFGDSTKVTFSGAALGMIKK